VVLDDDLVGTAQEFTGIVEKTALIREALKALIGRESARRLASLGGTMPRLKNIPRRRVG
jgi:Arc/MetJ family transcription regulator